MSSNSLQNKKIIISAGASGIGWATTKVCVAKGASIYLCDIDSNAINKVKKHSLYNKRIFVSETDASDEIEVIDFFYKIKKKFRNLDALINNVGIEGPTRPIEKLDSKEWENTLHVNVNSHFYFTKQAIPLLKKSKNGSIINISSVAGIMGYPLRSPYAASKWAVVGITKTLAMELGKYKIRVNAICPGTIKGDRMKRVIRDKAKFEKVSTKTIENDFVSMASMRSWINPEDIGNMCAYLISDEANKVSGQVIAVDGNCERMD
jgi:NAD(P)-dependent dehydrogenase (short-subunit alcohol dehydrogenase family)